MPRLSRGCLRCRQRRVKCDEGRPSCRRCLGREEICVFSHRDDADLVFRHETYKIASRLPAVAEGQTKNGSASSPSANSSSSGSSSLATRGRTRSRSVSLGSPQGTLDDGFLSTTSREDSLPYDYCGIPLMPLNTPSATLHELPASKSVPEADDAVASRFFDKYVIYPCSQVSMTGFLEHLPSLFKEVNVDGRCALRYAVQAAAFADLAGTTADDDDVAEETARERELARRSSLEYYGKALSALRKSLSAEKDKAPDDHDLMAVVVLDIFESLYYAPESVSKGAHVQGMAHILRLRGYDQFHDPRGWSLFRVAQHRLQKQHLAFKLGPSKDCEVFLSMLSSDIPFVRVEKDAFKVSEICQRGRTLVERILNNEDNTASSDEVLDLVREMHVLDRAAVNWRTGPEWAFHELSRSEIRVDDGDTESLSAFPSVVQLHPDLWNSYEWNYHRTARIIMHEQLLTCLCRIDLISADTALLELYEAESLATIRSLAESVLRTVPQSFGDIDHTGRVRSRSAAPRWRGIGAYLLLWPIKIIKNSRSGAVTEEQRRAAQDVFERIREYTGMKSQLGELSII